MASTVAGSLVEVLTWPFGQPHPASHLDEFMLLQSQARVNNHTSWSLPALSHMGRSQLSCVQRHDHLNVSA
eukprot:2074662-Amphidinium_carterae.2